MKQLAIALLFFACTRTRVVYVVRDRVVQHHDYRSCPMSEVPVYLTTPCEPSWTEEECVNVRAGDEGYYARRLTWWAIDVHARCAKKD